MSKNFGVFHRKCILDTPNAPVFADSFACDKKGGAPQEGPRHILAYTGLRTGATCQPIRYRRDAGARGSACF